MVVRGPETPRFAAVRNVVCQQDSVWVLPVVLATARRAPPGVVLLRVQPTRCSLQADTDDSEVTRTIV